MRVLVILAVSCSKVNTTTTVIPNPSASLKFLAGRLVRQQDAVHVRYRLSVDTGLAAISSFRSFFPDPHAAIPLPLLALPFCAKLPAVIKNFETLRTFVCLSVFLQTAGARQAILLVRLDGITPLAALLTHADDVKKAATAAVDLARSRGLVHLMYVSPEPRFIAGNALSRLFDTAVATLRSVRHSAGVAVNAAHLCLLVRQMSNGALGCGAVLHAVALGPPLQSIVVPPVPVVLPPVTEVLAVAAALVPGVDGVLELWEVGSLLLPLARKWRWGAGGARPNQRHDEQQVHHHVQVSTI